MKKYLKKGIGLLLIIVIVSIGGYFFKDKILAFNNDKIDKILKTKEYSYLPKEALNYIKDFYDETGIILKTEKNKDTNDAYLNPEYVEYLELSEEEKKNIEIIPRETIQEYTYSGESQSQEQLPAQYDLRNVDGKNYVTPVKDQGALGICWIFSAIGAVESTLLKTGMGNLENPEIFNERTVDYIRGSGTYFEEGYNPYMTGSKLGTGGGPNVAFEDMQYGFAIQPMEGIWQKYFTNSPTLSVNQVFNFKKYVVTDFVTYPILEKTANEQTKNEYYNTIKRHIMTYGAVSVSSLNPNMASRACHVSHTQTTDGIPLLNNNEDCNEKAPNDYKWSIAHSMVIVGWNDDYRQSYCGLYNSGTTRTDLNQEECEEEGGTYHDIKGAWILKNSWGTWRYESDDGYLYLAYESQHTIIDGIKRIIERDFDKFYSHYDEENDYGPNNERIQIANFKKGQNSENLKRISFESLTTKQTNDTAYCDIYLKNSNGEKIFLKRIYDYYQGVRSIDVDDYILTGDKFSIIFEKIGNWGGTLINISAFTANNNDILEKNIGTNASIDYVEKTANFNEINKTRLKINIMTNNMEQGEKLLFKLYNSNNEDISDKITDFIGHSTLNYFYKEFEIEEKLPIGEYTLVTTTENGTVLSNNKIFLGIGIENLNVIVYANKYNGKALKHDVYDEEANFYVLNQDYIISDLDNSAGTHKVTLTGIGNYKGSYNKTYTVLPKELTVIMKNKRIKYNQDLDLNMNINDVSINGVVDGETPDINGQFKSNYQKGLSVGEYNLEAEEINLVNNDIFKSKNYEIKSITPGTLIVEKATPSYTIPNNLIGDVNQKLSDIELPNRFEWMNPEETISQTGTVTYKAKYTPSDTINYEIVTDIDIPIVVESETTNLTTTIPTSSLCKCSGPTTCGQGYSSFAYSGGTQTITTTNSGTGYTLSGNNQRLAGSYTVTATLEDGYIWSDSTTGTKTFTCYIPKATPIITLSPTSGTVEVGSTITFNATTRTNTSASLAGTISMISGSTAKATVTPSVKAITIAGTTGVVTTGTITGVEAGTSIIRVNFTPSDTANYNSATQVTYTANVVNTPSQTATIPTSSLCKCSGPTTCGQGYSSFAYSGGTQTITTTNSGTGYTLSGNNQRLAGSYTVTANLEVGYTWSDSTTGTKTFICYIPKATPIITLNETSGTVEVGSTITFNEITKSGSPAVVTGTLTIISESTNKVTVLPNTRTIAVNQSGVVTTGTITGVEAGTSIIRVNFTPSDKTNYNSATQVTYTANVVNTPSQTATIPTSSLCKCSGPTTCGQGYSSFAYSGGTQTITTTNSGTGYTLSGNNQRLAGSYTVTATLENGYIWSDNTTGTKTFTCYIPKATPIITLSPTSGTVEVGSTITFNATTKSGSPAVVAGTISMISGSTAKATVTPSVKAITIAGTTGVVTTGTITGVEAGTSIIRVNFTPSDTANYNSATQVTYTANVVNAHNIETIKGDMNNNNKLDLKDIIILIKKYLGTEEVTNNDIIIGDMNNNNKLDLKDIILLIREYLQI